MEASTPAGSKEIHTRITRRGSYVFPVNEDPVRVVERVLTVMANAGEVTPTNSAVGVAWTLVDQSSE